MDNTVWGTSSDQKTTSRGALRTARTHRIFDDPEAPPVNYDSSAYDNLFGL